MGRQNVAEKVLDEKIKGDGSGWVGEWVGELRRFGVQQQLVYVWFTPPPTLPVTKGD